MTESCKLLTNKYDNRNDMPKLTVIKQSRTTRNDMKLVKGHMRYDMRKHFCQIELLTSGTVSQLMYSMRVQ